MLEVRRRWNHIEPPLRPGSGRSHFSSVCDGVCLREQKQWREKELESCYCHCHINSYSYNIQYIHCAKEVVVELKEVGVHAALKVCLI